MKSLIKKILIFTGFYNYIRWSWIFKIYIRLRSPETVKQANKEYQFLRKILISNSHAIIFDVGANHGDKIQQFLRFSPKKVIAFEPDTSNQRILNLRFRRRKNFLLDTNAVSDRIGKSEFYVLSPGDALNSLNPKWKELLENESANRWNIRHDFEDVVEIATTTLDESIKQYGKPDYIKIDVEGHELSCLLGLNQPVKAVSFECNLPEFLEETLMCIDRLNVLDPGYVYGFYNGNENFIGNCTYKYSEATEFVKNANLRYFEVFALAEKSIIASFNPGSL